MGGKEDDDDDDRAPSKRGEGKYDVEDRKDSDVKAGSKGSDDHADLVQKVSDAHGFDGLGMSGLVAWATSQGPSLGTGGFLFLRGWQLRREFRGMSTYVQVSDATVWPDTVTLDQGWVNDHCHLIDLSLDECRLE
jgi:hypothetical protein